MKIYLLFLLFILFCVLAIFVYSLFYFKNKLYLDLVYVCKYLKNNISFNKDKICILFENVSKDISFYTRYIIKNYRKEKLPLLKKTDIMNIKNFINNLGSGNVDYEVNNLTYYENSFEDMSCKCKELLKKDGVMYLKLIIGIGLALCVMLI